MTHQTKPTNRPSLESLEDRCVPALTVQLTSQGVLGIWGTNNSETVTVRQKSGALSVDGASIYYQAGQRMISRVSAGAVRQIQVVAYGGNDVINLNSGAVSGQQAITIPAKIWGGSGNDQIIGGNGSDIIYAGDGDDRVWGLGGNDQILGENGNDTLYGNSGSDRLYGGNGNDGLFGGDHNDSLDGGAGADRLLFQQGDSVSGATSVDAVVPFLNADRAWNEWEIEAIDEGLGRLHARTNNTRLLKLAGGGQINFVRHAGFQIGGDNNSRGTINMYDGGFYYTNWQSHGDAAKIAVHEIGHNWDSNDNSFGRENAYINQFRSLSGWTTQNPGAGYTKAPTTNWGDWWYRNGTAFTSDYARSNPLEDFAESFAKTMGYAGQTITQKSNVINAWLNSLRTA